MEENKIPFQIHETTGVLDGLNFAKTFDISNCSALVLVGGDGTIHESINGLMRREDKKLVPIGLIPNGSGDDTAGGLGLGIGEVDRALKYIIEGDIINIDVTKVLIDHESEDEIE